jgi:hypothetical protein
VFGFLGAAKMAANGNVVQMAGQRFGFLVVLRRASSIKTKRGNSRATWVCRCDCGKEFVARGDNLRNGKQKSCGKGHHFSKNRIRNAPNEFRCYNAMMQRCYNINSPSYRRYGGRGIIVCARWRESFDNFYADVGPRPSPKHSLDRYPNRNGNYEPDNVRWATDKEQAQNRDDTVRVKFQGKLISVSEYAQQAGVNSQMLRRRLARGWSIEDALTTPSGESCESSIRNSYPAEWLDGSAFKNKT